MGCSISKSTLAEGVRQAQYVACKTSQGHCVTGTPPANVPRKRATSATDSANENVLHSSQCYLGRHDTGLVWKTFSSASEDTEEPDVLTGELCADPYDTADTQADDEKVKKDELADSSVKARASRLRLRIERGEAEANEKWDRDRSANAKEHATLCENYDDLVRLDKIRQTKKEENRYHYLRSLSSGKEDNASHLPDIFLPIEHHDSQLDGNDDKVSGRASSFSKRCGRDDSSRTSLAAAMDDHPKQLPSVVRASMQRLSKDLSRRATVNARFSDGDEYYIKNSDKFHSGTIRSFVEATEMQSCPETKRNEAASLWRSAAWRRFSVDVGSTASLYQKSSPDNRRGGVRPSTSSIQLSRAIELQSRQHRLSSNDISQSDDASQLLNQSLRRRTFDGARHALTSSDSNNSSQPPLDSINRGNSMTAIITNIQPTTTRTITT